MRQSENLDQLAPALVAAQSHLHNVGFDKQNSHFKSQYTSLASICEEIRPIASQHGLAILQLPATRLDIGRVLCTRILHQSGQWLEEDYALNPTKDDPQGMGSAITYARRYSLPGVGCFASSDNIDDDGEAASAQPARPAMTATVQKAVIEHLGQLTTVKDLRLYWDDLLAEYDIRDGSAQHLALKTAFEKRRTALASPVAKAA